MHKPIDYSIKPIRSELDHARAVATIDSLWGAPDGSLEAEQLDVPITLVDAHEREQHAIAPPVSA